MIESKIRLTLVVPGATMLSSQECEKNPKENYKEQNVVVKYTKGKGKHTTTKTKVYKIHLRSHKPATQSISICKEAYDYMLSTPTEAKYNRATKGGKRIWDTMTIKDRLKMHFDTIANDLNAISYSYEILDD